MERGSSVVSDGWFQRVVVAGVTATSEATFPENELGAPDWKSTEMVRRTLEYVDLLPPRERRLLRLLFAFVELAAVVLLGGLRRFSKHTPLARAEAIRRWRRHRFQLLRYLGDGLKATSNMIYMSHPAAIEFIGEYRACDRPLDTVRIRHEPAAFERAEHRGPRLVEARGPEPEPSVPA